MAGQINRAQLCLYLSCCEGRSTGLGPQGTRCQVSGTQGQAQAAHRCYTSGRGQMQEPQNKNIYWEKVVETLLKFLHLKNSQVDQGIFISQPASFEDTAKLLRNMLLPWHRPKPTTVLQHHQPKKCMLKIQWMDVPLQGLPLHICLIFLWSPKLAWPDSLFGCSCTAERFIPSTPFYLYLLPSILLLKTCLWLALG